MFAQNTTKIAKGGFLYPDAEARVSNAIRYVESGKPCNLLESTCKNGFYLVKVDDVYNGYMFYSALGLPKPNNCIAEEINSSNRTVIQDDGLQAYSSIEGDISVSVGDEFITNSSAFVICPNSLKCDGSSIDSFSIEELVSSKLLSYFKIMERRSLEEVLTEAKLSMSGLIDDDSIIEAGNLAGATSVIIVRSSCLEDNPFQSIKVVSCSTGKQLLAATGQNVTMSNLLNKVGAKLNSLE